MQCYRHNIEMILQTYVSTIILLLLHTPSLFIHASQSSTPKMTATNAAQVDPAIYAKSGDISKHLEGVKKQYDTQNKIEFYKQVMGDGTANIHFGKWDNVDLDQEGAYGKASEQMTDYMFELVSGLCDCEGDFKYVDLGSGTGAAALRLVKMHPHIKHATCLNLCDEQNALATKEAAEAGLESRIEVVTGTYEDAPLEDNKYDACFSQDAFVHAFEKKQAFKEAFRVTKPGGAFVWCDLMCGSGEGVSDEELQTFAATNMVNDWLSPEENVAACQAVGWEDVKFVDLTADIRISFQLMLKKVEKILADGNPAGIDEKLLASYKTNLGNRITQVDRGVFKWGVVHAKKPTAAAN